MQVVVPFTCGERKHRWGRSMRTSFLTPKQNSAALQQEAHHIATPPPSPVAVDRQHSSSFSLLGEDPESQSSSECSPTGSDVTRHMTLLDLMADESTSSRDTQHSESPKTTLEELIRMDKKESPVVHKEAEEPMRHTPVSNRYIAARGTAKRRSSYLPYKAGLLSIFCMSPARIPLISTMNRQR